MHANSKILSPFEGANISCGKESQATVGRVGSKALIAAFCYPFCSVALLLPQFHFHAIVELCPVFLHLSGPTASLFKGKLSIVLTSSKLEQEEVSSSEFAICVH